MQYLLTAAAGLLAAAAAWWLNNLFLRFGLRSSIAWSAPAVEETVKTGFALLLHAIVPGVHLVFGLVEALYDLLTPPISGYATFLTSILGHFGFGLLTLYLARLTGNFFWGWAGTVAVHVIWNNVVLISSESD